MTPYVSLEFTPNPNTLKYVTEVKFLDSGAANFLKATEAEGQSPLASELFKTPGVSAVMIGRNFVTVTKADGFEWDQIHEPTDKTIKDFISSGLKPFTAAWDEKTKTAAENNSAAGTDIESQIKKILDDEIRPAVAQDGGDIVFDKFENGIVYLFMQGSCAGCPSSTLTLKMGIETRLKELIPAIQEVVAI